jgi:hypothetical protein
MFSEVAPSVVRKQSRAVVATDCGANVATVAKRRY